MMDNIDWFYNQRISPTVSSQVPSMNGSLNPTPKAVTAPNNQINPKDHSLSISTNAPSTDSLLNPPPVEISAPSEGVSSHLKEVETEDSPSLGEKFQNSWLGQNAEAINAGLDAVGGITNSLPGAGNTYNGPKGQTRAAIDQGYNAIADAAAQFGPYGQMASMAMKAANMLNGVQGAIFGATDGMTTTDAIMDSPLGFLTGVGWINQAFGKKSDTITKNEDVFAKVGSSYGGSNAAVDNALQYSGKKYGAFSSGARKDANLLIAESRRQQNALEGISEEATNRQDLLAGMSSILGNRRALAMQGGYDQSAIRVGKHGMSLTQEVSESNLGEILLDSTITEISFLPEEFKDGGILDSNTIGEIELEDESDDMLEYIYNRFPILKNYDIQLLYDPNFNPKKDLGNEYGDIEYMSSNHDTLPYYNDYSKPEHLRGKSVVVYNDNITPEDIALDAISHGLRERDSNYLKLVDNLLDNDVFYDEVFNEGFPRFSKMSYEDYQKLSDKQKKSILRKFEKSEEFNSAVDGLIRALLVKDELSEKLRYNYSKKFIDSIKNTEEWKNFENYILSNKVDSFKEGGSFNIIPAGALHARLHHMENDENITKKGIPVVSEKENGELEQHAEIEKEEIILRLSLTKRLEELAKEGTDEAALEAGKILVDELLNNTIDNTNILKNTF